MSFSSGYVSLINRGCIWGGGGGRMVAEVVVGLLLQRGFCKFAVVELLSSLTETQLAGNRLI